MQERSALTIVLHAHLPWVRHAEYPFFLEEHWLFEAVAETYLPLIESLRALANEGTPFRLAIDVSPTLAGMLEDDLLRDRTEQYFARLLELLDKETRRTRREDADLAPVVRFYRERLERLQALYVEDLQRDVNGELARLEREGLIELATCAATHPLLPLYSDRPVLVRGQVRTAVREHERIFGRRPRGIWLPECAYAPPVDRYLAEAGLRWFVVDAHAFETCRPRPARGVHAPVYTEFGVAAFARDVEPARQVWSAETGYPGDPVYREFYRDVGWDLPFDYVAPFVDPNGSRMFTGLKYYRITDRRSDVRLPYDPEAARRRADDHAGHFFDQRVLQATRHAQDGIAPSVIVCPYDAELFGHWWFEGPWFLESLLRKMAWDQDVLATMTPEDVLQQWTTHEAVALEPATWGAGGYFDTWIDGSNDWCLPHLVGIGERLSGLLERFRAGSDVERRVLRQATREAMLAQASDWTFLMSTGTAEPYARRRFVEHVQRFNRLDHMLSTNRMDEEFLALCEQRDGLFPKLDLNDFV
jgi:1,4-alpha-glucan branching enzyme